jgi:diguanylate cyclase (GGDEF)-like protein
MSFMQEFMYAEINIYSLIILLLIFINVYHRAEKYLLEQKLFFALLCANALLLVFDTGMWLMDGRPGAILRSLYLFVTVTYYILNPAICFIWYLYTDYKINKSEARLRKRLIPMSVPVLVNAFLAVRSIFRGGLFYIDSSNVYHRDHLFIIMFIICYSYLSYSLCLVIAGKEKAGKENFLPLLLFPLPTIFGGIVQTMFYGISTLWVGATLSVLIIFITMQNNQLYTDYLTGLSNRRQLDNYLLEKTQSSHSGKMLGGVMIDLDSFKSINDLYGHDAGDEALKHTAKLLNKTFGKNNFIARYGGDEFVIVMDVRNREEMSDMVTKLRKNLRDFNDQNLLPYPLSFSIGHDLFYPETGNNVPSFLKRIDSLMYADKVRN